MKNKGFTLIELLVVVLIIGVLAAIALPQYYYLTNVTKVKANMSNLRSIADALERYALVNGEYPIYPSASFSCSNLNNFLDINVSGYSQGKFNCIGSQRQIVIWNLNTDIRLGYALQAVNNKIPAKKFFCYYQNEVQGLPINVKEKICKKVCNVSEITSNLPGATHKGCIVE